MTTMGLATGMPVYCTDRECGKVTHIAIDPQIAHVMEIIVAYGVPFFKQKRVVPFAAIRAVLDQSVHLTINSRDWDEFAAYQEVAVDEVDRAIPVTALSPQIDGTLNHEPPIVRHYERQGIDAERLLVQNGTAVENGDEVVGKVDHVLVEKETGKLTHIALRRGLLQQEHIIVPATYFSFDRAGLLIGSESVELLEQLPRYEYEGEDTLLVEVERYLRKETTAFQDVHAVIHDGVLHLTGTVISNELRRHAGELALTVPGVTGVTNDLTVVSHPTSAGSVAEEWRQIQERTLLGQEQVWSEPKADILSRAADKTVDPTSATISNLMAVDGEIDELAQEVSYALATDHTTGKAAIVVANHNGVIHLRGRVASIAIQQMANHIAVTQPGVVDVVNELIVEQRPQVLMH